MTAPTVVKANGQLTIPGWFIQLAPWIVVLVTMWMKVNLLERDMKQNHDAICLVAAAIAHHDPSSDPGLHLTCNGVAKEKGP